MEFVPLEEHLVTDFEFMIAVQLETRKTRDCFICHDENWKSAILFTSCTVHYLLL